MTYLQRWILRPQTTWLRKATFQLHLWSGIGIGLYVLLVSLTGSVLVYRNELYRAATRDPIIVTEMGSQLTDEQLKGLVYSLTPKPAKENEPWYQQPVTLGIVILAVTVMLNIIFW